MSDPNLVRWRLILGEAANAALDPEDATLEGDAAAADAALSWLYDRDPELRDRDVETREGSSARAALTVPAWLDEVHRLFPKETVERIERDAVERFDVHEVVTNPEVLKRIEPNETLLRAVLRTKHLMNEEVLAAARELADKVVRRLVEALAKTVRRSFGGPRLRRRASGPASRAFDARATIRDNLKNFDRARNALVIDKPRFFARGRRSAEPWHVILLVDESGSMAGSVIHAAITASCLWGLPGLRCELAIFDTEVVDLTASITDPLSVLMKVQLGGGTDIGRAVGWAEARVERPRRTLVVLVSDLFESAPPEILLGRVKALVQQGSTVLALAALDEKAEPAFDRDMARKLADLGAHVGAMTPGELVSFVAAKVRA